MTDTSATAPVGASVRAMLRRARTAALASVDQRGGHPYASLVLVATLPDATPVLLLSGLARHTRNLLADRRASLLIDDTQGTADPLTGARATLIGRVAAAGDATLARRRFLARHASAAGYADFADFNFYTLEIEAAHYIGGFGRIVEASASDILVPAASAAALIAAEPEILEHMARDHADAVSLYATRLAGAPVGNWRMVGIDPEGADLDNGHRIVRLSFSRRLETPEDARHELAHLACAARGASPPASERLT